MLLTFLHKQTYDSYHQIAVLKRKNLRECEEAVVIFIYLRCIKFSFLRTILLGTYSTTIFHYHHPSHHHLSSICHHHHNHHINSYVFKPGLWVNRKMPHLGAIPDGIIHEPYRIKCLKVFRHSTVEDLIKAVEAGKTSYSTQRSEPHMATQKIIILSTYIFWKRLFIPEYFLMRISRRLWSFLGPWSWKCGMSSAYFGGALLNATVLDEEDE